ncbi:MAG: SDR family NAD(P)-dependent oxidoreductase, partial [Anaeromyxobacteraceae bacterium]
MGLLDGKVAFVTGAASGIGLGIARALAEEGAKVALSDLRGDAVRAEAEKLAGEGREALSAPCDVTKEAELTAALDACAARFGSLDILVNDAGLQYVS